LDERESYPDNADNLDNFLRTLECLRVRLELAVELNGLLKKAVSTRPNASSPRDRAKPKKPAQTKAEKTASAEHGEVGSTKEKGQGAGDA
jgi:hypothetical protein